MSGVVIGVGAAIGAVVGGGSSIYSIGKQNRSAVDAFKKQMKYLQINYNYNQAALDRQEKSMYDSAMVELFGLSMNAYQNNAQIEAAIAETGLEGRSQEKIGQTIRGQTARQETAIKESYLNDVWNVRSQKDALYITTKNDVEQSRSALKSNLIGGTQAFMQVLSSAAQGAAIGAATAGIGGSIAGALGGKTGGALAANVGVDAVSGAAPTVTGASAASVGVDAVSGAAPTVAGAATGSALTTGLATGGALGAVGSIIQPAKSATTTSSSSLGSSFLDRFNTKYTQYKPWINFYEGIGKLGGQFDTNTRRGGYFY